MYTQDYQQMLDLNMPQPGALASGFMTPNHSPYEGRRDSVVSSQSSISQTYSFASDLSNQSEFPMPLTPCSQRSPFADETFMVQYNQRPESEFECKAFDGFTQTPQGNNPAQVENPYDPDWVLVSQREETYSSTYAISFPQQQQQQQQQEQHQQQDESLSGVSDWNSSFQNIILQPPFDGQSHEEHLNLFQKFGIQDANGFHTIMPSDSLLDVSEKPPRVETDNFNNRCSYNDICTLPMSLCHPMDLKEEKSEDVKIESDREDFERVSPPRPAIRVSKTGRKCVKREQRQPKPRSYRRTRIKAPKQSIMVVKNDTEILFTPDVDFSDLYPDECGRLHRVDGPAGQKWPCNMTINGVRCTKTFQRPEHRKRHMQTHTEERQFRCRIPNCRHQEFNRNDNCRVHYITHCKIPGKKDGRNNRLPLEKVISFVADDPKLVEKIRRDYEKEVRKVREQNMRK